MTILYAIGDIHGRLDLLLRLYEAINDQHDFFHQGEKARLIHIGDYIDGGPDSLGVIDALMANQTGFEAICLKGNHEDLLLRCLETDDREPWYTWRSNGGEETPRSLWRSTFNLRHLITKSPRAPKARQGFSDSGLRSNALGGVCI